MMQDESSWGATLYLPWPAMTEMIERDNRAGDRGHFSNLGHASAI